MLARITAALLCAACLFSLARAGEIPVWKKTAAKEPVCGGVVITSPAGACADGDTIKVKPFGLARLRVNGADPKAALVWRVSPSANVEKATTARGVLEFTAPPGTYTVELLVITTAADGSLSVEDKSITVEFEPCNKLPNPPAPQPEPKGAGKLDPAKAIAKISFPPFGCTACPIGPRRADGKWDVLTAAHCVSHVGVGAKGKMQLLDGRVFTVSVVKVNATADYCWMRTEESVEDMPYANLAAENPPVGTKIWHAGYGVDRPGNREEGEVIAGEDSGGQIRMSLSVSSGDSGGPILRQDTNEVISTVCCTRQKGRKADVWGAAVRQIRAGRPDGAAVIEERECGPQCPTARFQWEPISIPLVLP